MSKGRIRAVAAYCHNSATLFSKYIDGEPGQKFHVLPATAEAYERMVEQMWFAQGFLDRNEVKQQLRAIGITPPKKGRT